MSYREDKSGEKWCPLGRISIQRGNNAGQVEVVGGGAFNIAFAVPASGGEAHPDVRYASRCCGSLCAFWRRSAWNMLRLIPPLNIVLKPRGYCGYGG